jgi:predicted N-acetyltransferase YhbS
MTHQEAIIRPMRPSDLDGVVALDRSVTGEDRSAFYRRKLRMLDGPDAVNMCLTAELDGIVVGFVMGDMFFGEYGVPEATAAIDSIGVHQSYQDRGIGTALFAQFRSNLKALNVHTCYALVEWGDWELAKFLEKEGFAPSNRLNLEIKL